MPYNSCSTSFVSNGNSELIRVTLKIINLPEKSLSEGPFLIELDKLPHDTGTSGNKLINDELKPTLNIFVLKNFFGRYKSREVK